MTRATDAQLEAALALRSPHVNAVVEELRAWRDNLGLRAHLALRILRAWNGGTEGYDSIVVITVEQWIDKGMNGPIPWPDSPFFARWAEEKGYSNVNGFIGYRMLARLEE